MLDKMKTGQEFSIAGNSPFSNRQLAEIGISKILATQEYTHVYCMWKILADDDCTWVKFRVHLHDAYLERKQLKQTAGASGYGSDNNVKHGEIEDAFIKIALATVSQDVVFTNLETMNGNLSTQLRHR